MQTSGGAGPDEDFERIYRTQLQCARARGRRPSIEDPLDDLYDPKMAQREFMLKALESDDVDVVCIKGMGHFIDREKEFSVLRNVMAAVVNAADLFEVDLTSPGSG